MKKEQPADTGEAVWITHTPLRHPRKIDAVKILLALMFVLLVFLPLFRLFQHLTPAGFRQVFHSAAFWPAMKNSLISTCIATLLTTVLAFVLAMCIERTTIRCKGLFSVLFILPMLIPSISNGMGLVILFGNNGIMTRLLHLNTTIYGLRGIVMGSILYAFPVAFLMLTDIIRYEDGSPYEAAQVLGLSKAQQLKVITLPYLRKPLISVLFAVFTMIITDYGVPLMVGGKYATLPVVMYHEVIGQLNFDRGAVYGSLLLFPAVIAFLLDLSNTDKGHSAYIVKPYPVKHHTAKNFAAFVLCSIISVVVVLPIFSFVILAFTRNYPQDLTLTLNNIAKTLNLKADQYLLNSVIIAAAVSLIGIIIAFVSAYLSARVKSATSRFLHLSSITSAAIPGVVLGLSYVFSFKGNSIYGTMIILIMVNLIHFISSPYLMIYNSFSKINENLEAVAQTLQIDRLHLICDVLIPQCKETLLEMGAYFFVNCMMTISAVSFLANTGNKPIALMINQFEAQTQLECAAVVSLIVLAINLLVKGLSRLLKKSQFSKNTSEEDVLRAGAKRV